MEALFLKLFNMSVSAGWIVLAILLVRIIILKAPKWVNVALWSLVGLRLCLPFSIKSILSLVPSTNTIPKEIVTSSKPVIESGFVAVDSAVNPVISENLAPAVGNSANPMQIIMTVVVAVWVAGIIAMLTYMVISYTKIYFRIREGVPDADNTVLCDRINTPFIMGVIKPKIYLPSNLEGSYKPYVIAHENAHIKRYDYLWKLLAFAFLTVYWFNPLIWVAYIMLCRDIEFACDEKVIRKYGEEYKAAYSTALLNCSIKKKSVNINPLAFGEISVKDRIKNILNYKKPPLWITLTAIVLSCCLLVGFMTDPVDDKKTDKKDKATETVVSKEDITSDTVSTPAEPEVSEPIESKPIESKPQDTSNKGKPTVSSTPKGTEKPYENPVVESGPTTILTDEEDIRALIEIWRNSPSKIENKQYREYSVEGNFVPGTIILLFTEKATKENFYKDYTVEDFPELDIESIECEFQRTRNIVLEGKKDPHEIGHRFMAIKLKEKTKQAVIDGIKLIENREDLLSASPSQIVYVG